MVSSTARGNPRDLEDWMARSATPDHDRAEIRRRLDEEIAGGEATGLRRGRTGEVRTISHAWATILAQPV